MSKVDLTPAKLADIKKKAEFCDPKIWKIDEYGNVVSVAHTVAECGFVATCGSDEDTQFIAAADPATVLALVEEIAILRRALQELTWDLCGIDLEQEQIDKICNEWIQKAKMLLESEAGQ